MVARTRFELVISALRGRRPKPLDERAMWCRQDVAGTEGIEPPLTEPESVVLPLDDVPMEHPAALLPWLRRKKVLYGKREQQARPYFESVER